MNLMTSLLFLIASLVSIEAVAAEDLSHPDKKVSSKTITGTLHGAQQGDYFHASVKNDRELEVSFLIDDEICFLAQYPKIELIIEYDVIDRYFPEGGGYYPANIIQSISTRGEQKRWGRNKNAVPTLAQWRECSSTLLTIFSDNHSQ